MSENRIIIAFSLSPPSFLFRYTPTRHTAKEESTRLQLPAAEGSGTFQPHRMIWNHSNLAAETQSAVGPQPQSRADFHSYHTRFLDLPTQRSYTRAPLDWPAEKHAAFLQHPCKRDKEEDKPTTPNKRVQKTDPPSLVLFIISA